LSYERLKEQGASVEFPPGVTKCQRTAFGRNGKGRHAAFCFSDKYSVETSKDGRRLVVEVSLTDGGEAPFRCQTKEDSEVRGLSPGTTVSADLIRGKLPEAEILEVIGSRFIVDPSFAIQLNGRAVELFDLQTLVTNNYAENGEAFGYRKVLIVELKRGGFTITQKEVDQARDYIKEIRATGCVEKSTQIEAYILGSSMEEGLESSTYGNASIMRPFRYDNLLTRAHVRTFNLHQKIEAIRPSGNEDPELKEVLSINEPLPLFVS
jgi:hypothetical protein